jgi:hypothetical protein
MALRWGQLRLIAKEKASSAAPVGRLLNERKIPAYPLDNP